MKFSGFKTYFLRALFFLLILITYAIPGYSMNEETGRPRTVQKTLSLANNTFEINGEKKRICLPYIYSKVDPQTTRVFFEGEVVIIDPESSQYESYVTYPLLPCILGRIYNPVNKRSLAFHKSAIHGMHSLEPFYPALEVTDPNQLKVSLYTCELSQEQFVLHHAKYYDGKTQSDEIKAVRNFLAREFYIPKENIEVRFYKKASTLPDLGPYYAAHLTVGIKKTGELFHTALLAEDIFNFRSVEILDENKHQYLAFSTLPFKLQRDFVINFVVMILLPNIQERYVGERETIDRSGYGKLKFFIAKELDIPAASFPEKFEIKIRDDMIQVVDPFFGKF